MTTELCTYIYLLIRFISIHPHIAIASNCVATSLTTLSISQQYNLYITDPTEFINKWSSYAPPMIMGDGNSYANFIVIHPQTPSSFIEWNLNQQYSALTGVIGLAGSGSCTSSNYADPRGTSKFNIYLDGELVHESQIFNDGYAYENIDIDVSGKSVLRIEIDPLDNAWCDHDVIANPELLSCPTPNPTMFPTQNPSASPTPKPTESPTKNPTLPPTVDPTESTLSPSTPPTIAPSDAPTFNEAAVMDKTTKSANDNGGDSNDEPSNQSDGSTDSVLAEVPMAWLWITLTSVGAFAICIVSVIICGVIYLKAKREEIEEIPPGFTDTTNKMERVDSASVNNGEAAVSKETMDNLANPLGDRPPAVVPMPPVQPMPLMDALAAAPVDQVQGEGIEQALADEGSPVATGDDGGNDKRVDDAILTPQGPGDDDDDNDENVLLTPQGAPGDGDDDEEDVSEKMYNEDENDPEHGGNIGKCTDCGETREGRMYDTDSLFYCNECWLNYE